MEKQPKFSYEQRCRAADMRIRTAIIEVLPDMDPFEKRQLFVALHRQLLDRREANLYAAYDHGDYFEPLQALPFKSIDVELSYEPDLVAVVDIEMGRTSIGYLQGNSVHLFDD
jgi:hypothetical protein